MREDNPDRESEKVMLASVPKEKGYLYYIDEDGDVSRVPAKWNKDPKFLEKVQKDQPEVDKKFREAQHNYPEKQEVHEEPIPATPAMIPKEFMDSRVFYIDKAVVGLAGEQPLSVGHVRIASTYKELIEELDPAPFIHNQTVASFCASLLYEALKAQGTNIIMNEENGRIVTSVVPRFQDDGLGLMWEIKQGDRDAVAKAAGKIRDALIIGEKKDFNTVNMDEGDQPKKKVNILDYKKVDEEARKTHKKNYMIDHLRRPG